MSANPLLEKIKLPGKVFQLPSRGYLYSAGELSASCVNGEIHVKPMSALDEIAMKNPDMLFSGKAAEQVFSSCILEIEKPLELFGKDFDAIMIFLRMVTYGTTYEIEAVHNCADAKSHTYGVDLEHVLNTMKYIDPTTYADDYTVVLDNGQVVRTQPIRYRHVLDVLQGTDTSKEMTAEQMQKMLVRNILNLVVDIDGISDKKMIEEWTRAAPVKYISKIADSIEKTNTWGPNLSAELTCRDCGKTFTVDIPINPISFFSE